MSWMMYIDTARSKEKSTENRRDQIMISRMYVVSFY